MGKTFSRDLWCYNMTMGKLYTVLWIHFKLGTMKTENNANLNAHQHQLTENKHNIIENKNAIIKENF